MDRQNILRHSAKALVALLIIGAASSAHAVLLLPNQTSPQQAEAAAIAGTLISTTTVNITGINDINPLSTITELAVKEAGGTFDFYFQLNNISGVGFTGLIHQFNANFYSGYTTNVFWDNSTNAGGLITAAGPLNGLVAGTGIPDTFSRTPSGGAVQFNFPDTAVNGGTGALGQGQKSKWLVIRTNATQIGAGIGGVINGITQNFALVGPVPEPGSCVFGLGVLGVVGSMGFGRRRSAV